VVDALENKISILEDGVRNALETAPLYRMAWSKSGGFIGDCFTQIGKLLGNAIVSLLQPIIWRLKIDEVIETLNKFSNKLPLMAWI